MTLSTQSVTLASGDRVSALLLSGVIGEDDGDKLTTLLRQWTPEQRQNTLWAVLDSEGGSLREGLRMARTLRQWGFVTHTLPSAQCISACVFLYAAGLVRVPAVDGHDNLVRNIGLHRAFVARTYLKNLGMAEAEQLARSVHQIVERAFVEFDLPSNLFQAAMATSSTDVRWLNEPGVQSIATYPAWFEEFVLAKCDALQPASQALDSDALARTKSGCAVQQIKLNRMGMGPRSP